MIQGRPTLLHIPAATPFKPAAQLKRELGVPSLLRMGANENPLGPSPLAMAALAMAAAEINRYPDAGSLELRTRLSEKLGFPMEWIVVEAGISGLLRVAAEAFVEPGDKVVFPWPTFAVYPHVVRLTGGIPVPVDCGPDLQVDFDALAEAAQDAKMVWLCNPNNPTGLSFGLDQLRAFLKRIPPTCVVVLDEAYYEFGDGITALPLVAEEQPVIVMRTFSKAHGIAGLRVGYAVMRPDLAGWFNRSREPFQLTLAGQAAALAAVDDEEHLQRSVALVREGRAYLAGECARLGIPMLPSTANFVLLRFGGDCRPLGQALLQRGIMVRATDDLFELPGCLRVTVGTPEMNQEFLAALAELAPLAGGIRR
jgi:histidinol-phosphate aminotransferase